MLSLFPSSSSIFPNLFTLILCLFFFSTLTNACASNGICGGGCCGQACSPPPAQCNPASCQPGYSCGHYGCARNRARSALTRKDGLIVPVEEWSTFWGTHLMQNLSERMLRSDALLQHRTKLPVASSISNKNIFGVDRQAPIGVVAGTLRSAEKDGKALDAQKAAFLKLTNPNFLFRQCCEDRRLPDACLWKCHFNTYTKNSLQEMFFRRDGCPIEAAADLQYCAGQGRDHTPCCSAMGIGDTLAGNKCLTFCDQRAGKLTKLDYSYLPCYDRFESMKRCFYDEIRTHMELKLGQKFPEFIER